MAIFGLIIKKKYSSQVANCICFLLLYCIKFPWLELAGGVLSVSLPPDTQCYSSCLRGVAIMEETEWVTHRTIAMCCLLIFLFSGDLCKVITVEVWIEIAQGEIGISLNAASQGRNREKI